MLAASKVKMSGSEINKKFGVSTYDNTYIHTYIYLISRFVISNCTADVDLLLLSLDERTKIYNTVIYDKKTNQII